MKILIKATLVLVFLIVMFIKVYSPLMNGGKSGTYNTDIQSNNKSFTVKETVNE